MGGTGSGKMKNAEIVRLDGTVLNVDGSITTTKLFEYLDIPLDDYSDIEMTPDEATRFINHVKRMKTGVAAFVPKLCPGNRVCAMRERCPFQERFPLGRACPLEISYIAAQTKSYVESLGVDPGSPYEMALVNTLVENDLFDYRANLTLSSDSEGQSLLKTQTMQNEKGGISEVIVPHPILTIKDNIHKKRLSILEALAVTRKEQYKEAAALKKKSTGDASQEQAKMRKLVEKLQDRSNKISSFDEIIVDANRVAGEKIIEADWEEKLID